MLKYSFKKRIARPFLHIKNDIAFEVNNEFEKLTGYTSKELIGKSIADIKDILKIDSKVLLEDIESEYSCYIFTKESEPREVTITCKNIKFEEEQIYNIKEKRDSRIEDRMSYITSIFPDNDTGVAIYSVPDGIILKTNEKFTTLNLLYNIMENCIGKRLKEVSNEHKDSKVEDTFLNVIKTGKPYYKKEIKYKNSENCHVFLYTSLVPIYIKGEMKYIVHTAIDVTNMVESRDIIEQQQRQLEVIIENMSEELMIFDKNGEHMIMNKLARDNSIFYFNKSMKLDEIYRQAVLYRQVEIYDMLGNLIEFENLPINRILAGEKIVNFRYVIKSSNGIKNKEASGTPIYDNEGNIIAGVVLLRNIDELLKYEENLYRNAQFDTLNGIIENLDLDFMRFTYPGLTYIDINSKAYNLLKKLNPKIDSKLSIKGKSIFDFHYGEIHLNELIEKFSRNDSASCFEIFEYNINGEEIFRKFICQPLYGLNNEIVEIILMGIDITEEIKAKEKMKAANKVQDVIYANVAHELKTPLNVIFSANQMMEMYLKNDNFEDNKEKFFNYNNSIKQNCYRLIKLINNIVDLSKSKSGFLKLNLSNENIVKIVEDITESVLEYAKSLNLRIIFDTNVEERIISCDPNMIERVVLNLISNALKFSNPNSDIYINVYDKGSIVEISVKDTGIGIDKKHLDLLFERFYQVDKTMSRNAEGSGIGLSLIKSIVEMHGGRLSVESEVGKGSIFKVELPAIIAENLKDRKKNNYLNNKIEMVNIEFSDIYNLNN